MLGADPAPPTSTAHQPEPPAVRSVTPAEWLKAQPKPLFRPGYTLPRLTRYGWVLPTDARIELAEHWGYALEFGGYLGEADAARVDDPKSDEAKLAALAKADPKRYPLAVICTRKLPGTEAPPETWTRDKDGKVLNGKAQSMDGTQWSEEKGAIFSPEAPDAVWKLAGEYRAGPLRELQKRDVPISIVLNGGEYGLGVLGFAQPVWSQDPRIVAAVKQTTNGSWRDYASARKGLAEKLIADEVRTAVPQRQLYVYYTAGGRTLRNKDWSIDDWGPKWKHMRGVSDLPSNEIYYRHFNDGFTGRLNLLTIALNAVAAEIATGDPLSYNWICAGWPRGDEKKYIADLDRWTGFLKCYYTAGMIGGNVGYYDFPKGGFAANFPADAPPVWLRQMAASAWTSRAEPALTLEQPNAARRPTLVAQGIGGRPALRFKEAKYWLAVPNLKEAGAAFTGPLTAFALFTAVPPNGDNLILSGISPHGADYIRGTGFKLTDGGVSPAELKAGALLRIAEGELKTPLQSFFVGTMAPGGGPGFTGDLAEILIYKGTLLATKSLLVQQYLADRYKLLQ